MIDDKFAEDRNALYEFALAIIRSGRPIERLGPQDKTNLTWAARCAIGASDMLRALDWAWEKRRKPEDIASAKKEGADDDTPF